MSKRPAVLCCVKGQPSTWGSEFLGHSGERSNSKGEHRERL